MRILLLSQFFDPEPSFKGLSFAEALLQRGHDVEVLTGFPNYPGGRVYPGYRLRMYLLQKMNEILVHRVWLYPSHSRSKVGRILNYVSFCVSSFFALLFLARKFDVIYVYHPPITVGFAAAFSGLVHRKPFVIDIQDLWPDTLSATGMLNNPKILKVIGHVCTWVYRRAAKIVVLSPGFKKCLTARGVPESKIEVIYNWCNEQALGGDTQSLLPQDAKSIVFAGNMGRAQALGQLFPAIQKCQKAFPQLNFYFVGDGLELEQLKKRAKEMGLSNIYFPGRVPMTEVSRYLSKASALLVHLNRDPLFEITVPSKTQAYMAVGRPLLMGVRGDAADLIHQAQAGFTFQPEDSDSFFEALQRLLRLSDQELEDMGSRGKAFYFSKLSFHEGVESFQRVFRDVVL